MPRRYRMQARAESAEATRARVIEAARAAILDGPSPRLSMGDVARRAGVARSTLYEAYGSLAGVIGGGMGDGGVCAGLCGRCARLKLSLSSVAICHALPP